MTAWTTPDGEHATGRVWAPGPLERSVWCLPDTGGPAVLVELSDDDTTPNRERPEYRDRAELRGEPPRAWVRSCRGLPLSDDDWRRALGDDHADRQTPDHGTAAMDSLFD